MKGILSEVKEIPVAVPKNQDFETRFLSQMNNYDEQLLHGQHDHELLMPTHVQVLSLTGHYFALANTLEQYANDPNVRLNGWWLHIGGRSLYLKNQDRKTQFYISDFGLYTDIFDCMKRCVIDTPWISKPVEESPLLAGFSRIGINILDENFRLPKADPEMYRLIFTGVAFYRLQEIYPSRSAEHIISLLNRVRRDDEYLMHHVYRYLSESKFISRSLQEAYKKKVIEKASLIQKVHKLYPNSENKRHAVLSRFTALDLITEVNKGSHKIFFRPQHAFYEADSDGASYATFARVIGHYLEHYPCKPNELAQQFRRVLKNEVIPTDELDFLPNLCAAWFVAEATRNRCTIPASLMILDFLQNPQWLDHDSPETQQWYTWRNVFLHPEEGKNANCLDLYGDAIEAKKPGTDPITYFRGLHPMVHLESRPESATKLMENTKLSRVRQKEGSILLHWITVQLRKRLPNAKIEVTTFTEGDKSSYLTLPDYAEISMISRSSGKAKKVIDQDAVLTLKKALLDDYILPLLKMRCLTLDVTPEEGEIFLHPENHPVAFMIQEPPLQIPRPLGEQRIDFMTEQDFGHLNIYKVIGDALQKLCQISLQPDLLQQMVSRELLASEGAYNHQIKTAIYSMVLSLLPHIQIDWVIGLTQLYANNEKHVAILSNDVDIIAKNVKKEVTTIAFTRVFEANLPDIPHFSAEFQDKVTTFKIQIILQWADLLWFRQRVKFLNALLQLPTLYQEDYNKAKNEIESTMRDARAADQFYKRIIDNNLTQVLLLLFSQNTSFHNVTSVRPVLEILAKRLKLDIHLYEPWDETIAPDDSCAILQTPSQRLAFQRKVIIPAFGKHRIELFYLGEERGYIMAKRTLDNQREYVVAPNSAEIAVDSFIESHLKKDQDRLPPIAPRSAMHNSQAVQMPFFRPSGHNSNNDPDEVSMAIYKK